MELASNSHEKLSICSLDYEGKYRIMHENSDIITYIENSSCCCAIVCIYSMEEYNTMTWDVCQQTYASCNSNFPAQS